MAISFLGLTENAFWRMSPRRLLKMIDEWKKVQRSLQGIVEPGEGEQDEDAHMTPEQQMWASWDAM